MNRQCLIDAEEEWKPVVGYEGSYEISSIGNVRSLDRVSFVNSKRTGGHTRKILGRPLQTQVNNIGYVQVPLYKNGVLKLSLVHRLVAKAFIPNPDVMEEVNHLNGVKDCNLVSNLEWTNRKENSLHSTRQLLKNIGEDNKASVLTEDEVLLIKEYLNMGMSQTLIAKSFNVGNHAISRIKRGYNWAWLTGFQRKEV